jgi:release factor glutamine methyltransferase
VSTPAEIRSCRFGPLVIEYDNQVLEPRPWTYQQSEWAAEVAQLAPPGPLLEVCAGAGQIGLAAAVLAARDLVQVEADPVAAGYAHSNAARAGWADRVEIRVARLQSALAPDERFSVIIADPPYLPSADLERWPDDPPLAINGGDDGLDLVRACLELADQHLSAEGKLVLQTAGTAQNRQVAQLLATTGLAVVAERVTDEHRALLLIGRS